MKTIFNSFVSLLLVAFIVLKLCNVITWSWFWVLSPAWITIVLLILAFIVALIHVAYGERRESK